MGNDAPLELKQVHAEEQEAHLAGMRSRAFASMLSLASADDDDDWVAPPTSRGTFTQASTSRAESESAKSVKPAQTSTKVTVIRSRRLRRLNGKALGKPGSLFSQTCFRRRNQSGSECTK